MDVAVSSYNAGLERHETVFREVVTSTAVTGMVLTVRFD
jgi:hypothetical protein